MDQIIAGTTPIVRYRFREVNAADIVTAFLTIKVDDQIVIEKTIESATIDTEKNTIEWRLTQEETLAMQDGDMMVEKMINYVLRDGNRGAATATPIMMIPNHKNEVI